jgi:hypothetical protein
LTRNKLQRQPRIIRRLETEFTADNQNYRGISSDLSLSGLFIRTNHAFVPGTKLDIVIHLPGECDAKMTGLVRRAYKTPVVALKNGMGVEIVKSDINYVNFVRSLFKDSTDEIKPEESKIDTEFRRHPEPPKPSQPQEDFIIVACPQCGVKNKIKTSDFPRSPKCGRCGALIPNLP